MKTRFILCIASVMLTVIFVVFLPRHPLVAIGEIMLGFSCIIQGGLIIKHIFRKEV